MRIRTKITLYLVGVATLLFTACTKETKGEPEDSQDVVINIAAVTRSDDPKTDYSDVGSLRVLGYKASNGILAFNEPVLDWAPDNNINGVVKEIKVKTGIYMLVFIANEHLDSNLSAILADNNRINTLLGLSRQAFAHTAFQTSGSYVPMLTRVNNVNIIGNYNATCDPVDYFQFDNDEDAWILSLSRLAVKLRLHLFVSPSDLIYDSQLQFHCNNLPTKVFLLPQTDNSAFQTTFTDAENTYKSSVEQRDGITLPDAFTQPSGYKVFGPNTGTASNVMILPESYLSGTNNIKEKGVLLTVVNAANPTDTRTGRLIIGPDDYSLTRNAFLDIAATINQPETDIEFFINVVDWEDEEVDPGILH